jgi:UDP-2,3-diacylglucosamine hydrolase
VTRTDLFISDIHLDEQSADRRAALRRFLDCHVRGDVRLFVLGDLFNAWIGRKQLRDPHVAEVADALRDATRRGAEIHFVAGNRDFYGLRALARRTGMVTHKRGFAITSHGQAVWMCHGHHLFANDRRTHAAQAITHSWPVAQLFQALPARLAKFLAQGYQSHSGRAVAYKTRRMLSIDDGTMMRLFAAGHDVVVCGHTHRMAHAAYRWHGRQAHLYNLGTWEDAPHFLRHTADGWHFHQLSG